MRLRSLITAISLLLAVPVFADDVQRGRQLWTDPDGSPDQTPFSEITTPSGGATDDGDGTATLNFVTSASPSLTGDVTITDSSPSLVFVDSTASEDDFELIVDGSVARYVNTDDRITSLIHYADNSVGLGETGFAPASINLISDGTGNHELIVPASSIGLSEVFILGTPTDGQFVSYQASTGQFLWSSSSGSGDITSVGDVASGAAFDGTQGTTITFNNAGGDATLDYDGTDLSASHPVEVSAAIPRVVLTDTTGSEDDWEWVVQSSVSRIVNTTDGITSLIHYASNAIGLGEAGFAPTSVIVTTDGTGNGEVVLPLQSISAAELDTPNITFTRSAYYENLAAADDNKSLGSWNRPVTIRGIRVHYNGSPTTTAIIALEDGAGNAMTHGVPHAVSESANAPTTAVTANNTLVAGELLRFDVTNAVSPESDDWTLDIDFTYDA